MWVKAVAFQQEMTLHGMLFTPVVMIVSVQVYLLEFINMLTITHGSLTKEHLWAEHLSRKGCGCSWVSAFNHE